MKTFSLPPLAGEGRDGGVGNFAFALTLSRRRGWGFDAAQQAEQLALCPRRLGRGAFAAGLADQRAQVLVVEAGMGGDECSQRSIPVVAQQFVAQRFGAVQRRGIACAGRTRVGQRRTRGDKFGIVMHAHHFGQVRKLALVRNVRGCALHDGDFVAHVAGQIQFGNAGRRQIRKLPGQGQHVQCFALARAAAWALVGGLCAVVVHGGLN